MANNQAKNSDLFKRLSLVLGFILVVIGMVNNLPTIPGLLEAIQLIPGLEGLPRLSKYNPEYFFPLVFAIMLLICLLTSSFGKDWFNRSTAYRYSGIAIDISMLLITVFVTIGYLMENDSVCLIDQLSGERARLIALGELETIS